MYVQMQQGMVLKRGRGNPGEHWPRKGVRWCAALKTPLSPLSCSSQGFHFKQKSQFTRPPFEKLGNFSLRVYSLKFTQIWAQPPNLKIFSSQAPEFENFQFTSSPFQRQISVRKPHTSEIRAEHPYMKKIECPPGNQYITLSHDPQHQAFFNGSQLAKMKKSIPDMSLP